MISFKNKYDVIVVGGGPAGSTTGALLAEKGHDVLILEKEKFPRYHVGESLMPFCYFPLERLGLVDRLMESANPRKYCVQFVRQDGFLSQPFYFFQHFDHPSSTTWQVWRSEFDKMILDKARQRWYERRRTTDAAKHYHSDSIPDNTHSGTVQRHTRPTIGPTIPSAS